MATITARRNVRRATGQSRKGASQWASQRISRNHLGPIGDRWNESFLVFHGDDTLGALGKNNSGLLWLGIGKVDM